MFVLAAAGILLLGGGIAAASIPSSNGVFYACMNKKTGALRLIDPSLKVVSNLSHCAATEKQVNWNKSGAAGRQSFFGPIAVAATDAGGATGPFQTLFTGGQFTFLGTCGSSGGHQEVDLWIKSSANHSAWAAAPGGSDPALVSGGGPYGNANTDAGIPERVIHSGTYSASPIFGSASGSAVSPDGHMVFFNVYMGQNARGAIGDACIFGGSVVTP